MTLAERAASAKSEETEGLLEEAASLILWQPRPDDGSLENLPDMRVKFYKMLYAGAYLDAAMMLVPEVWDEYHALNANGYHERTITNNTAKRTAWGTGATSALALIAAVAQSKGL